jgi:hypothetical protein
MFSLIVLLIISWHIVAGGHIRYFHKYFLERVRGVSAVNNLKRITNLSKEIKKLDGYSHVRLKAARLPQEFLRKIVNQRVGIFPWEIAYVAANNLNYAPFPILQAYSAYTSPLDLRNANYLEDLLKAPEFILMSWSTVDQRHPLIDVPAMWISLYKWYDVDEANESVLLLKKRRDPRFSKLKFISKKEYSLFDLIKIPSSQHPILAKISINLSLLGKLSKIFFRIPEVYMAGMTDLGGIAFRVMPDVLRDGALVNYIPTNLEESDSLIRNNMVKDKTSNLKIYGDGTKYFNENISVEFYEIPEVNIVQSKEEVLPPVFRVQSISSQSNYEINSINTHSFRKRKKGKKPINISEREQLLVVKGWAIDAETEDTAGGVYIDIDGKFYRASFGSELREGIRGGISDPKEMNIGRNCGYIGVIPISEIGLGPHTLSINILTKDKTAYYKTEEKILLEIR